MDLFFKGPHYEIQRPQKYVLNIVMKKMITTIFAFKNTFIQILILLFCSVVIQTSIFQMIPPPPYLASDFL